MPKRNRTVDLNYDEARKAIEKCLSNAESFLGDAELLILNKRVVNVSVPLQIAMEEIGKAQIIINKIDEADIWGQSDEAITLSEAVIIDHPKKLRAALSVLTLPLEERDDLDDRFNAYDCPIIKDFVSDLKMEEEKELRSTARKGHSSRMASSYVDFDYSNGRAFLNKPKYDYTVPLLISAARWTIREIEARLI